MRLKLTSWVIGRYYAAIVIALLTLHLLTWAIAAAGYPSQFGLRAKFDFDAEASIPAMFAAVSLLGCGVMLAIICAHVRTNQRRWGGHWGLLAFIFVFLALDEATGIHEMIGNAVDRYTDARGVFAFVWIVPYGIAAAVGACIYWPWLRDLPSATRTRFIFAAALYVGGAIGMEMIGAWMFDNGIRSSHWYTLVITVEETLEFSGVGVFLAALIEYLRVMNSRLTLDFAVNNSSAAD